MATGDDKNHCVVCSKEKRTFRCEGCSQTFCYNHLPEHRQELSRQLDEIETEHDLFRHKLTELINDPSRNLLIEQINEWEKDSIQKIQEAANEYRRLLLQHPTVHISQVETDLTIFTDRLRNVRQEDDFNEIDLNYFREKLEYLKDAIIRQSNVSIEQDNIALINKIRIGTGSSKCLS